MDYQFLYNIFIFLLHFSLDLDDGGKLKYPCSGSITHGSELTFLEFLDLFKSFSLRLRKDIRTLFANHSVCNAATATITTDEAVKDLKIGCEKSSDQESKNKQISNKKKAFLCKYFFLHFSFCTTIFLSPYECSDLPMLAFIKENVEYELNVLFLKSDITKKNFYFIH